MVHLEVILWWLLDRSPQQRATDRLLGLLRRLRVVVGRATRLPGARAAIRSLDAVILDGLLGSLASQS